MWLLACTPSPQEGDTAAPEIPVLLSPLDEHDIDGSPEESDTHPSFDRTGDGRWITAWDAGVNGAEKALARTVDSDGAPLGDPEILSAEPGDGFLTPDLQVEGGDWYAVLRIADRIDLLRGSVGSTVTTAGPTSVGADSGAVGFWTAPDLALVPDGVVIGWWEGTLTPGTPATYFVAQASRELAVNAPMEVGESDDVGSPVAVEATPDGGTLVAWSVANAHDAGTILVRRVDAAGEPGPVFTLGQEIGVLASRPSIAVDPSGAWAVGWRVQDEAQQGLGVYVARFDANDVQIGDIWSPGLAPETTNRVDLSAHDGILAAAWEEVGVDGDVFLQLVALEDGSMLSGAVRVHDDPTGDQARPNVAVSPGQSGLEVAVAWESVEAEGSASSVRFRVFRLL